MNMEKECNVLNIIVQSILFHLVDSCKLLKILMIIKFLCEIVTNMIPLI